MSQRAFFIGSIVSVVALGTLSGCSDPRDRQEVTGEVRFKGQPVQDGYINFAPLEGQQTGDGAQIVQGKYQIPRSKGLSPGKYKVSIYAGNGLSGQGDASPDSPNAGAKLPKERIPPAYNEDSKLIRDVSKDGANKFDFNIP
jgi:hypothetical protein